MTIPKHHGFVTPRRILELKNSSFRFLIGMNNKLQQSFLYVISGHSETNPAINYEEKQCK